MRVPLIYKEAPTFGFDIGSRTVKAIQIKGSHRDRVTGYGYCEFPPDAIVEGIISDPEAIAKSVAPLLKKPAAGQITARRATVALPTAKVFIRTLQLPLMSQSDLEQAIRFEAEQYVPVPITDLYIDYEVIGTTQPAKGAEPHSDVLMVAAPRAIVDSYINLFDVLDLELAAIETSLSSIIRSVMLPQDKQATLIIDFGSRSADMAVVDQAIRLTGTIPIGGDDLSRMMVKGLGISFDQADEIKYKFGIGPSGLQPKIKQALGPAFATIIGEIKKVLKYQQERSEDKLSISRILLSGGSASMPGLADQLSSETGLPAAIADPWTKLELGHLPSLPKLEKPMYATAIGLSLRRSS